MQVARLWRDAGDRLKTLRGVTGLGIGANVGGQVFDPLLCVDQLVGEQTQGFASRCR